ncbi:DUF1904 family protein [Paenibacillus sinopodophylli]|uniref:DUF1904 family protein n=1 Tax=Paenibacillus sinopodophylli TaxID=1837342 RepID=UPI00110C9E4E|nr:DUF1904 family protein [Paenibacillus sinopodophylli]
MPHLLFRGVAAEQLRTVTKQFVEELAVICECGTDNFTMACLHTTNVLDSTADEPAYALVEAGWFDRGPQVRTRFAQAVTRHLMLLGIHEVEIVFHAYREDSYYINGEPVEVTRK